MKVILQPCASPAARKHLDNTIHNRHLKLLDIKEFLEIRDYENLLQMYADNQIRIWGVTSSSKNKWNKISMGDIVLFSANKTISSSATIIYKLENEKLAEFLWGKDKNQQAWKYIYFIDELTELNVSYEAFNTIVNYKPNNIIQGFSVLSEEKSSYFLDIFNLESARYIDSNFTKEQYKEAIKTIKKPDFDKGMNIKQSSFRRAEQGFLRQKLFGNRFSEKCSICGKELPIEFLWCSHIKKRCKCTDEELIDFENIVTPMCKLGCDDLYERGFLGIKEGIVTILNYTDNETLDNYMKQIEGRRCEAYNEANKKYFDFHTIIH